MEQRILSLLGPLAESILNPVIFTAHLRNRVGFFFFLGEGVWNDFTF